MEKRVQRHSNNDEKKVIKKTRTSKNKYLYDEINNKIGYEEITNFSDGSLDLSVIISKETSEESIKVSRLSKYEEQTVDEIQNEEEKIYDINSVLEEAKKNRIKYDELEKKRKLKENGYATLADINNKEAYMKNENHNEIDEEELTNLINTITSHNLLNEIKEAEEDSKEGEILSDLLATNIDLNLEEGIAKEFVEDEKTEKKADMDNSFYTKSMNFSEQDFEFAEELEKDKKLKLKIIVIISLIFIILGVIIFVILKQKGIL